MPGLVGVLATAGPSAGAVPASAVLDRMLAALRHRPWYQIARYQDPTDALAIGRIDLGILSAHPHPYVDPAGHVRIFLHGELYNEEAAGDPLAFIARCYASRGLDFAAPLNGSFAIVLLDALEQRLLVATDRTASKPLFYWHDGSRLYIAPELKALLVLPDLPRTLDWAAVAGFLTAGHFLNNHTLLEGVRLIDNASVLSLTPTALRFHRYWEYSFGPPPRDLGRAHYEATLGELLGRSVRSRLRTAHRYGVLLSGGYDSRGILGAYLAERPGEPVVTLTWGTTENEPDSDCAVAARLAREVGTEHHFLRLRPSELVRHVDDFIHLHDGLTDACGNYPEALRLFEIIRAELGVQVILRGDHCFGYSQPVYDEQALFEKYNILPPGRIALYRQILRPRYLAMFSELVLQTIRELSLRCPAPDVRFREKFYYVDQRLKHYLNPLNYLKGLEVEVRSPYLDNEILDFMRQLPTTYQFGKQFYRQMIVKRYPALFRETAHVSNLGNWSAELKTSALSGLVRDRLLGGTSGLDEFIDLDALGRVMEEFLVSEPKPSSGRDITRPLRGFLVHRPRLYRLVQRAYRGLAPHEDRNPLSVATLLFRLLILSESIGACQNGRHPDGHGAPAPNGGPKPEASRPSSARNILTASSPARDVRSSASPDVPDRQSGVPDGSTGSRR